MTALPTLSVLVTCKNSASTLADTLESIAAQTYDGWWEVVVVDNASTDETVTVANGFAGRLPNLRVLGVPNPGYQAAGLNHGIAQSTGEAIAFLDSDDLVAPGYLTALGAALATAPFVGGAMDIERLNPPEIRGRRDPLQQNRIDVIGWKEAVIGASMGARREVVEKVGGFDESLPTQHDLDISWRLADMGVEATFVPGALLHYRYRVGTREIFSQERGYGEGEVVLYRKFRPLGMPRRSPRQTLGDLFRLLRALVGVRRTEGPARLATTAGKLLGRVEGSVRYRTLYL
ncbi:glycosyltransferase [Spongisporangium articulatum]|uniref:Glycosyltransferase n=1 Tax=Spongisporangium articulatum TaxID=3362603 RepID=A0ABW8AK89_9ACTN